MHAMTNRERVLRTYRFEATDRAPVDFFEGTMWPLSVDYFRCKMGLETDEAVRGHFGVDCRWYFAEYSGPAMGSADAVFPNHFIQTYSDHVVDRPLRDAQTIEEVLDGYRWAEPEWWDASSIREKRKQYPDHGLVLAYGWMPAFGIACEAFGFENALEKMLTRPDLFAAANSRQNDFLVALLDRLCSQAEGIADICWMGDDYADQRGLIMGGDLWRQFIKEPLRRQVEAVHRHGMSTLFHSCGAVREILPDLIEIGVDALEVFQTTAAGMDTESIARDFGGKIAFVGGIDCQEVLSFGSEEDTRREVRRNVDAFADCGGYIVTNAHMIESIKPENIVAMLSEARDYRPRERREG